jgi:hypothetical protein
MRLQPILAVGVGLLGLGCVSAAGLLGASGGGVSPSPARTVSARSLSPRHVGASRDTATVKQVQSAQVHAFSLFKDRPNGLPFGLTAEIGKPFHGLNLSLAQRLSVSTPGHFWAVPGNGYVCIFAQLDIRSLSVSCVTTHQALTHGVAAVLIHAGSRRWKVHANRLIVGIAPDWSRDIHVSTPGGPSPTVPVKGNTFAVRDSGTAPPEHLTLH